MNKIIIIDEIDNDRTRLLLLILLMMIIIIDSIDEIEQDYNYY